MAVLECFARYFGEKALGPLAYAETDWGAEIYSRGGYAGVPVPGMLLDHGPALTEPVGCIYWAGAETASEWSGYMDGAVESGERAAREVLSRSRRTRTISRKKVRARQHTQGVRGCRREEQVSIHRGRGGPTRSGPWSWN